MNTTHLGAETRRSAGRLIDDPGIQTGLGGAALVAVALVTAIPGITEPVRVAALLLVAAAFSLILPGGMAALIGVSAWAIADGFVINEYGELSTGGGSLLLALAFLGTTLIVSACGRRARLHRGGSR